MPYSKPPMKKAAKKPAMKKPTTKGGMSKGKSAASDKPMKGAFGKMMKSTGLDKSNV